MSTEAETPVVSDSTACPPTQGDNAPEPEFHGETFTMTSTLFNSLREMGFSENAIKKSIASGCIDEDTCTQWISMHQGHPELDTPLDPNVRVIVKEKRVLTEEERLQKVEELKEKIRQKKAAEAVELAEKARADEKRRIEMGKHMLEAKEVREARQRAVAEEERRREKEADMIAREKVQMNLAVDKLVRHGMSQEAALKQVREEFEDRKKRQREEAAERLRAKQQQVEDHESARASSSAGSSTWNLASVLQAPATGVEASDAVVDRVFADSSVPEPTSATFAELVARIPQECKDSASASACLSTLRTILANIVDSPLDLKKRMLKTTTTTFRQRIACSPSAVQCLRVCNFALSVDENGHRLIVQNIVVLRHLHRALAELPRP